MAQPEKRVEKEREELERLTEEANAPPGPPDLATAREKHPEKEAERTFKRR